MATEPANVPHPPSPGPAASSPTPPSPPPAHPMRWAFWLGAGLILVAAVYFGFHWFTLRHTQSVTKDAFVEAHIVNVAPEMVSGRIVRYFVDENDRVEQGQVIAEVEPIHYRDQVEQARGKLELAKAELKRQEAGLARLKKEVPIQIDVAQKSVDEAQAAAELAKANLTLAKLEFARFTELAAQDASTLRKAQEVTRTHDAAKADLQLAEVRVAKAIKALDLAKTGNDQIREVELLVDVKKEVVEDARIGLDSAEHLLAET